MARTAKRKMSAKKKFAAVMASILALALLIGGAFAWTDFSQSAINRFRGNVDPDVTLHDDFEPNVNKDVYIENTGEVDLIVRVKFNEYFQIGNVPIVGGNANDKDTWETHMFPTGAQTGSIPAVVGELDDNCKLDSHEYFSWLISGATKIYKPGTGEMGNYTYTDGQTFPDNTVAKPTLPEMAPITMAEYIANKATYDAEANGRWILDTDGWCYWSKLLVKDTATNLLLDNVVKTKNPDDNYLYNIDVILQASNVTEAYLLVAKGMSDEAENHIIGDLTGIIKLRDGRKLRFTGIPKFYEVLDDNGKSRSPREYIYDPDDNIKNDKDINGDEKPAVKGSDNNFWIDNEDGTFISSTGLQVTAGVSGKVGDTDDIVVIPQSLPTPTVQPTMFNLSLSPRYLYTGEAGKINVEFTNGSNTTKLRYLTSDPNLITVDQQGNLKAAAGITDLTPVVIAAVAPDGSYRTLSFSIYTAAHKANVSNYLLKSEDSAAIVAMNKTRNLSPTTIASNGSTTVLNIEYYSFKIVGGAAGCKVSSTSGLFTAGALPATVNVEVTAHARNNSSTTLDSTVNAEYTTSIAPGAAYTTTSTITVTVEAAPSLEAQPYATAFSGAWATLEPAPAYAGGTGTVADPYLISSIRQLKKYSKENSTGGDTIENSYQQHFKLTSDFNFAGADMGGATSLLGHSYGTFDGNGKVIRNLDIGVAGVNYAGIFNNIAYAEVKNLGREGGSSIGASYIGAIAATLDSGAKLTNCYNTTPVTATGTAAGLVYKLATNATIENCYNTGAITGGQIGGLVVIVEANAGTATIKNSYNSGALSGTQVGGIVSYMIARPTQGHSLILDSVRSLGTVTRRSGSSANVGSIMGYIQVNPALFSKVQFINVQSKPGLIFYGAAAQPDIDVANRTAAMADPKITFTGSATFNLS